MTHNRLVHETSPYLLQHKDNPVHWWAWGPDALAEAQATGKPILLSVGYAACHWCHVMAHESFEDAETAGLMNQLFVNIKVDREERPDIDNIYQTALAMLGQHGGWPLTMFLTPKGEPFWGGTYFPPSPRWGRPSFREVLQAVAGTYAREPDKVAKNVTVLLEGLREKTGTGERLAVDMSILDRAARGLLSAIDTVEGGLHGAPKFPQPTLFQFLLHAYKRLGSEDLREAVTLTLDRICHGGIYDHLGGGFHRYAVDEAWLVPHFEKMLYDNAQLVDLLTLAWQETGSDLYRQRVRETNEWTLREMLTADGAFASSLDADSEGVEGKFYVWTHDQLNQALTDIEQRWFKEAYDCRPGGNWDGHIILNRNVPQPRGGADFETLLADCRAVLFREREKRVRPGRDDKVLADWNGLMIAALANSGFVFEEPRWLDTAARAFATVVRLMEKEGRLMHSYRAGRSNSRAVLDDYANMARAALILFEATGEGAYLTKAEHWVAVATKYHWDGVDGGFFLTAEDAGDVIVRTKTALESATPAGNGVMVQVLARLYALTGKHSYADRADATVAAFSSQVAQHFPAMASLLNGFELLQKPVQVVLVGNPEEEPARALTRAVAQECLPNRVLTRLRPGESLPEGHPAHGKDRTGGKATAYVCHGPVCSAPAHTPQALHRALQAH